MISKDFKNFFLWGYGPHFIFLWGVGQNIVLCHFKNLLFHSVYLFFFNFPLLKARCTPEKLTILTKQSKTFFYNHIVKNIVNYQLQKLHLKWTSIKGSNYAFATWCHSALKYL